MSSLNPISFRFPFKLPEDIHPEVASALRYTFNGLVDVNQAIASLNDRATAASSTVQTVNETVNALTTSGVQSFNQFTGAISYFPSLGTVNNQLGESAYTTQQSDAGAKIIVGDSSGVEVTLSTNVNRPWFCIIDNDSSGVAVLLTDSTSSVNGGTEIGPDGFAIVYYDGNDFWSGVSNLSADSGAVSQIVPGDNVTVSPGGGTGAVTVNARGTAYTVNLDSGMLSPGQGQTGTTSYPVDSGAVLMCSLYDPTSPGGNEYLSPFAYNQGGFIGWSVFNVSLATVSVEATTVLNIRVLV